MLVWISAIAVSRWRMPVITPVSDTASSLARRRSLRLTTYAASPTAVAADQPGDEEEPGDDDQDREGSADGGVLIELVDQALHRMLGSSLITCTSWIMTCAWGRRTPQAPKRWAGSAEGLFTRCSPPGGRGLKHSQLHGRCRQEKGPQEGQEAQASRARARPRGGRPPQLREEAGQEALAGAQLHGFPGARGRPGSSRLVSSKRIA